MSSPATSSGRGFRTELCAGVSKGSWMNDSFKPTSPPGHPPVNQSSRAAYFFGSSFTQRPLPMYTSDSLSSAARTATDARRAERGARADARRARVCATPRHSRFETEFRAERDEPNETARTGRVETGATRGYRGGGGGGARSAVGAAGDGKDRSGPRPTVAGGICAGLRVRSHLEKYSGADSARHGAARARGSAGRRGESDRAVTHRRGDVRGHGKHFGAR